jgi:hypothetical protein
MVIRKRKLVLMSKEINDKWETNSDKKISSYIAWSILLTFWFIPFGIVAIIYSSQVIAFSRSGDYLKAERASKKAKIWCWITLAAGLISAFFLLRGYGQNVIQVVPGRSIAGIELNMSGKEVISRLGKPSSELSGNDMEKFGRVYSVSPRGDYLKETLKEREERENIKIFLYQNPPLTILINKNNRVEKISLGYSENIAVTGYPFLEFRYLTQDELKLLGKPSSEVRMRESEQIMMSKAPPGTIYEYYEYFYNTIRIKHWSCF